MRIMRLGKYSILNETTYEVLIRSKEHGIMTIEHITDFIDTDVEQFKWLEADLKEAKKFLEKRSNKEIADNRFCSVCGVAAVNVAEDDVCANCGSLSENVQRAFISLRSTVIEQHQMIDDLREKVEKNR